MPHLIAAQEKIEEKVGKSLKEVKRESRERLRQLGITPFSTDLPRTCHEPLRAAAAILREEHLNGTVDTRQLCEAALSALSRRPEVQSGGGKAQLKALPDGPSKAGTDMSPEEIADMSRRYKKILDGERQRRREAEERLRSWRLTAYGVMSISILAMLGELFV